MNGMLVNRGHVLIYANSGQYPLAKDVDISSGTGRSVVAFTMGGKKDAAQISKDASRRLAKKISDGALSALLQQSRVVLGQALDPSGDNTRPVITKAAKSGYPVFVTLFQDGKIVGQSGRLFKQGSLEQSINYHVIQAALHDTNHSGVTQETFDRVSIKLTIPTKPKYVQPERIVTNRDGVRLEYRKREKIFLPDAWKRFPHPYVLLAELAAQTGLEPWYWRIRGARVSIFQVLSIREGEYEPNTDEKKPKKKKREEEDDGDPFEFLR